DASAKVPVIVDFWAPWCGPCKQLGPMIEKLVRQAGGLVRLVKINIDENQDLATQMQIQSIPAVFAFKGGRPVDGFSGAQPESQIRAFINRLTGKTKAPLDLAVEEAQAALDAGDAAAAGALYGEILAREPAHPAAVAGMIRAAMAAGDTAAAKKIIEGLPADVASAAEVAAAVSAVELAEQGGASGDAAELRRKLAEDENDHQTRYDLAVALYADGSNEDAVEELLELVRRDKRWNDEAARKQLVKIFEALGGTHPLTVSARRHLSSILFS
ncbi:MAG: thioredoxin, partial [Rhodospirillales bacterium]